MDAGDVVEVVEVLRERINGTPEPVPEVLPQLIKLLRENDEPAVLVAIIEVIGVAAAEEGSWALLDLAGHPDADVRLEVSRSMARGSESFALTTAIAEALIGLSRDESDEVRNWATFELGSILDVNTTDVRDALFARAHDSYGEVRAEALMGLARHRDPRAVALLREALAATQVWPYVWKTAAFLRDPSLVDVIREWLIDNPGDDEILAALDACDPRMQAARLARQADLLAAIERFIEAEQLPIRAGMYCERFDTDVLLTIDSSSPLVWWVDSLLDRSGNDADRAAVAVLARHRDRLSDRI